MSPVVNPVLPIGNASMPLSTSFPASRAASAPVQASLASKSFELAIPTVTVPGETGTAPVQIAPGKMLNIEGSTPADTAIPADVIPAKAIELLNASAIREAVQAETTGEAAPAARTPTPILAPPAEKPRWALERYLSAAERKPVATTPAPLRDDEIEPEVEIVGKAEAETNAQPDAAQAGAGTLQPITLPSLLAYTPVLAANTAAPAVKAEVAPSARTAPAALPSVSARPAAAEPVSTAAPVETASQSEVQLKQVIVATKAPQPAAAPTPQMQPQVAADVVMPASVTTPTAKPARTITIAADRPVKAEAPAGEQTVALAAEPIIPEARLAWAPATLAQTPKADAYAFVTVTHKIDIEAPAASHTRTIAEPVVDDAQTPVIDADLKAVASTQVSMFDTRTADNSALRIEDVKSANPLAELSGASHVAQRHLDLARDTLWLDGLARDIVAASDRSGSMSFRLSPANLGKLDVDLMTGDAGLSVIMKTSSEEATKIIAAAQPTLIDNIQSQGVRVADAQITSQADMSRQGQPQPQRHTPSSFIETGFAGSHEPEAKDSKQPSGRFA